MNNKWAVIYRNLTKQEFLEQLKQLVYNKTEFTISGCLEEDTNIVYIIPSSKIPEISSNIIDKLISYTIWQQVEKK